MEQVVHSQSGLQFNLHPLVLVNISDHCTRTAVNSNNKAAVGLVGCLLGHQTGRTVEIVNSFELVSEVSSPSIDMPFLLRKLDQYKQVFPNADLLGWYVTGKSELLDDYMNIHRQMLEINDSPVMIVLDPSLPTGTEDLPVTLYEHELHLDQLGQPEMVFVQADVNIVASDAERIGVDQIAKLSSSSNATQTNQIASHLTMLQNSGEALKSRVEKLCKILREMANGHLPFDPSFFRECCAIANSLNSLNKQALLPGNSQSTTEVCDALLGTLLASITLNSSTESSAVEKHNLAHERLTHGSKSVKGIFTSPL